jgi:hypothetical protein
MHPITLFTLFFKPTAGWQRLINSRPTIYRLYLLHVIPFSIIPAFMIYLTGGKHGLLFLNLLPDDKLRVVAIIFFVIQLVVVPIMAIIVRQLAEVAEIHPSYGDSFILASVAPTPLWMAPVFLFIPDIYVNSLVITVAMMAAVGLMYFGIPTIFRIEDKGRSFLFFGAVLMAGLMAWVFLMVCTLVIWGSVQNLHFTH